MPTYEYMCKKCGPFTQMRAMAEYELPSDCPECGAHSPRVLLTAPRCLTMSPAQRQEGAKYDSIVERYEGHEPPPYIRPPGGSTKPRTAKATAAKRKTVKGKTVKARTAKGKAVKTRTAKGRTVKTRTAKTKASRESD
jgi:putative FmdB family regulatory protein